MWKSLSVADIYENQLLTNHILFQLVLAKVNTVGATKNKLFRWLHREFDILLFHARKNQADF